MLAHDGLEWRPVRRIEDEQPRTVLWLALGLAAVVAYLVWVNHG